MPTETELLVNGVQEILDEMSSRDDLNRCDGEENPVPVPAGELPPENVIGESQPENMADGSQQENEPTEEASKNEPEEAQTEILEEDVQSENVTEEASSERNPGLEKMEEILSTVQTLQQYFEEKIETDAHKNQLFDNMHRELVRYQNGLLDKIVDTMALDIIQLADSTRKNVSVYEKREPTEDNYKRLLRVVKGIYEDLQDILYRQSIESYSVPGHDVDVKRQKIIATVETEKKNYDNKVAVRTAEGYEKDGKVLRPERIKIYKYNPKNEK